MPGGTWTTQNKTRPGVYINFRSEQQTLGTLGERGIVSLPLALSWGPAKQVITVEAGADTFEALGYPITAPQLLLVREALKRARTLLLYRLNAGTQASATVGGLTVTARYGGTRGNDISVVIQANIDDPAKFDVKTLVAGAEVDSQTVATLDELQANAWVSFTGTGEITPTAGTPLTGGTDFSHATITETTSRHAADGRHGRHRNGAGLPRLSGCDRGPRLPDDRPHGDGYGDERSVRFVLPPAPGG